MPKRVCGWRVIYGVELLATAKLPFFFESDMIREFFFVFYDFFSVYCRDFFVPLRLEKCLLILKGWLVRVVGCVYRFCDVAECQCNMDTEKDETIKDFVTAIRMAVTPYIICG